MDISCKISTAGIALTFAIVGVVLVASHKLFPNLKEKQKGQMVYAGIFLLVIALGALANLIYFWGDETYTCLLGQNFK